MATTTFYAAIDLATAFVYDDVDNLLESPTEVQVGYPGQSYDSVRGTRFTFNKSGDLIGGTITSFRASEGLGPGCSSRSMASTLRPRRSTTS